MFTRKETILKRTGPNGIGRYEYLSLLVKEFYTTQLLESKEQIIANIANFSYDPINFDFIRNLNIIELFVSQLTLQENENLVNYSIAGLCNLSADVTNQNLIIQKNGIPLISQFLLHNNEEISLNALTCLLFLITIENKHYLTPEIIKSILVLRKYDDRRFKNLATVFVEDLNIENEIHLLEKEESSRNCVENIPLPSEK